jgi:excisionase family DNA binding protein
MLHDAAMPKTPTPDLISTTEACEILGIDRSGITRRVQMGRLTPALRLPGKAGAYLFHRADVEQLARQTTP